jgi:hypothetical protein
VEAFGYNNTTIAALDKLGDIAKMQEKLKTNHQAFKGDIIKQENFLK